jgi:hypothetical protein
MNSLLLLLLCGTTLKETTQETTHVARSVFKMLHVSFCVQTRSASSFCFHLLNIIEINSINRFSPFIHFLLLLLHFLLCLFSQKSHFLYEFIVCVLVTILRVTIFIVVVYVCVCIVCLFAFAYFNKISSN